MIEVLALFAVGRLLYSFVACRKWKFIIIETSLTGLFVLLGVALEDLQPPELGGILQGGSFIILALASRILFGATSSGDTHASSKSGSPIGIIDFVWILIMGATLAIVAFSRHVQPFSSIPPRGLPVEYYQAYLESSRFLLSYTLDSVFILGGILGVCMSILWSGAIWRKRDESENYNSSIIAAIKMVIAYFIVILNAMLWVGVPLYNRINEITEYLRPPPVHIESEQSEAAERPGLDSLGP